MKRHGYRRWSTKELCRLITVCEGESYEEIAEELGRTRCSVEHKGRRLLNHKRKSGPKPMSNNRWGTTSADVRCKLMELVNKGMNISEIARHQRKDHSTIYRTLRRMERDGLVKRVEMEKDTHNVRYKVLA